MTTEQAKDTISSSDFTKWLWYLDWYDTEKFDRRDYYDAQITSAIERHYAKTPQRITLKGNLLCFKPKGKASQMSKEEYTAASKAYWRALVKMPPRKPPPQKRKN